MRFIVMLAMLSAIIAVHELGHAVAMHAYGVLVEEFSIGIGPVLWQTTVGDATVVSVRALPIGGYTAPNKEAMAGLAAMPLVVIFINGMFFSVAIAFALLAVVRQFRDDEPFMCKAFVRRLPPRVRPLASAFLDTFVAWPVLAIVMMRDLVLRPRRFFAKVGTPIAMLGGVSTSPQEENTDADATGEGTVRRPMTPMIALTEYFCAITIGFAACNFLPFAPLDGARIVTLGIAYAFGAAAAAFFFNVSTALFFLLIIVLVLSDLRKISGQAKRP